MMSKTFTLIFVGLIFSNIAVCEEKKFYTVDEAFSYYKEKNDQPKSRFKIKKDNMELINIDGKGGDDIFIGNVSFSGPENGEGGGVFLCQGKEKDCSDGYFCEANVEVFYKPDIKKKGPTLKCKK